MGKLSIFIKLLGQLIGYGKLPGFVEIITASTAKASTKNSSRYSVLFAGIACFFARFRSLRLVFLQKKTDRPRSPLEDSFARVAFRHPKLQGLAFLHTSSSISDTHRSPVHCYHMANCKVKNRRARPHSNPVKLARPGDDGKGPWRLVSCRSVKQRHVCSSLNSWLVRRRYSLWKGSCLCLAQGLTALSTRDRRLL